LEDEKDQLGPYNAHIKIVGGEVHIHWREQIGAGVREVRVDTFDRALWFMEAAGIKSAWIEGVQNEPTTIGEMVKAHSWSHTDSPVENVVLVLNKDQIEEFNYYFQGFWHI
jgi:hypothetical protein